LRRSYFKIYLILTVSLCAETLATTMMKSLPRIYPPDSGIIVVVGYSALFQIGNALTFPDFTPRKMIAAVLKAGFIAAQ